MFTGIVEELGRVGSLAAGRLTVGCTVVRADADIGASVAINGTCLTVVDRTEKTLGFDVSSETFSRTSLGRLQPGDGVNLERPVSLAARLGGHIVQGHVDGVGEVLGLDPENDGGARISIRVPGALMRYVVEKGSIAVDGVSLTVAALDEGSIEIALIPHTLEVTTLGAAKPGDPVNLEVDMIAKYVERLMERS